MVIAGFPIVFLSSSRIRVTRGAVGAAMGIFLLSHSIVKAAA